MNVLIKNKIFFCEDGINFLKFVTASWVEAFIEELSVIKKLFSASISDNSYVYLRLK